MSIHKPKYLHIPTPCSEDWNKMDATEQGAFCTKCTKEVLDLTEIKSSKIPQVIASKTNPCIRILGHQIDEMNWMEWFNSITLRKQISHVFLLAFIFVFHLNGHAQDQDTSRIIKTVETIPLDSNATDSSIACAPILIMEKNTDHQTDIIYVKEDEILMGIPPIDITESTLVMIGGYSLSAMPATYASINKNSFNFFIEEDELVLRISGKQADKVELRVYNATHQLIMTDLLRIEKGYIELNYPLQNFETGTYTIELTSHQEKTIIHLTY